MPDGSGGGVRSPWHPAHGWARWPWVQLNSLRLRAVWLAVCAMLCPALAWGGDDLIVARAWQADPTAQRTLNQVQGGAWAPAPLVLSQGYTADAVWLRLTIRVPRAGEPVVLRIRPSFLDRVQLHVPDAAQPGGWQQREVGDALPFGQRERASAALAFVWHPPHAGEHTVYLRAHTTSSLMLSVQALSERDAQFRDAGLALFLIGFLSVMLAMALWALLEQTQQRHPVNMWFLATQLNSVVFGTTMLGYTAAFLPATWSTAADTLTSVSVCLSTMLHLGFYRANLVEGVPSVASQRAVWLTMMLCPVQLALIAAGHTREAVSGNALVASLLVTPLVVWMLASSRRDGLLSRRVWWGVVGTQAALTLFALLPLLGWREAVSFNLQASLFFGVSSATLMLGVLMLRSRRARQAARRDRLRLALVSQRLTLAQQQRADQQQFLDMLGHELKTPLMTIRLATGALQRLLPEAPAGVQRRLTHIDASATAMNQVLERVLEANRLGDGGMPVSAVRFSLAELLTGVQAAMAEPDRLRCHGLLDQALHTDPDLLRVIVANLLDNACKYSPAGSPVTLTVRALPDQCVLTVGNRLGPAGAPDPKRVFRKYHRAEEARGFAGAGLGLWLGHNLAQRLGGSLSVRTQDDHVEFTLCLPLPAPV